MNMALQICQRLKPLIQYGWRSCLKQKNILSSHKSSLNTTNFRLVRQASHVLESPFGPVAIPNQTITEYVFKDMDTWLEKPMITCGHTGRTYTYTEGRFITRQFAIGLLRQIGLNKGDVVGILMPNIPEYAFSMYGALEAGLVVTFVNPLYTPEEVSRQWHEAQVKCCITIPQLLEMGLQTSATLPNYKGTVIVGGEHDSAKKVFGMKQLVMEQPPDFELPEVSPSDVAVLPFSSGTTGLPKGVRLSHTNCVVNLEQCVHPDIVNHSLLSSATQKNVFSVLPFFHIYGFNAVLNVALLYGLHMVTMPRFIPEIYLNCITKYKPAFVSTVPAILFFLASNPGVTAEHFVSVQEVTCGGAAATKGLIDKFKQKVQRDDLVIRQGYGMSETSPVLLYTRFAMSASKTGSVGQLVRGTQARVVSLKTGKNLPANKSGELYVRGPQVMLGYLKNEKATRETVDADGWLHTGDVAYYDQDGYFYIVDRTKELIKVKGNQVPPTELENIIMQLPGVADVAVIGIPDARSGEIPRAFVVKKPGVDITEKDVVAYVEPKVAPYKKLTGGVLFIDAIPRNAAGKVLRQELKKIDVDTEHH